MSMPKVEVLDAFIGKWQPPILDALTTIHDAIERAGYTATDPDSDVDMPELLRWSMLTWYPGRPESWESGDLAVALTLVQHDEGSSMFVPFIEAFNMDGSFLDDIFISDALDLNDDQGWREVMDTVRGKADHVVRMLQSYFPTPTKTIWKIQVSDPQKVKQHPSLHTSQEIAKQDVSIKLEAMLDRIARLFWEFEAVRMYSAWTSGSTYAMGQIRALLDQGEVWKALRRYQKFMDELETSLRNRVIKEVGLLQVERIGGYPDEEDY